MLFGDKCDLVCCWYSAHVVTGTKLQNYKKHLFVSDMEFSSPRVKTANMLVGDKAYNTCFKF